MHRLLSLLLSLSLTVPTLSTAAPVKYVALTFDDGPSGVYTRRLLEGLDERNVKATFFLCGYRMQEYPDVAQSIADSGHEIGCHGYSHQDMSVMSRRSLAAEIADTMAILPEGTQVHLLRPPGGICGTNVQQVCQARQLAILTWTVDPRDWAIHDRLAIRDAVLRQVHDGDVILMHDMYSESVDAALDIVDALQARGFRFVTASQMAVIRGYRLRPGTVYRGFPQR